MALKIPPPLLVLVSALIMWVLSELGSVAHLPVPGARVLAALLAGAGVVLGALAVASFRRARTTVNPHTPGKASTLVVSGIYRYSRNPMYLGLALILLAWGVFLSNLLALLVVPAFIVYMTRYQIEPEERALEARFGQEYLAYKRTVRRWP